MSNASTATGHGKTPMAPEQKARLEKVQEAFNLLGKAIKNIGIYRHNEARYAEFLERPFSVITSYTEAWGPLSVKVESSHLEYAKTVVFEESFANDSISYRFFRDGIRHIIFRPGLTPEELQEFALICMADLNSAENLGKDMMALMWEADFDNIEYIALDGFSIDDMSDEEVEVEVDKIVGYLYSRLKSHSDDYLRFARLSAEDLDFELTDIDQVRGAIITGQPCSSEKKAELQEEIEADEKERMLPKLVNIVFQVVEEASSELGDQAVLEVFMQLLDAMLLQEDFAAITQIINKFKALERDPEKSDRFKEMRETFVQRMGENERLQKIGEILNSSRPRNIKDIYRYLSSLDSSAIVSVLEMLDRIEITENRKVVCDALIALGKDIPEPFLVRLDSERSQLVRDMIYVIDRIDFPNKVKMFGRVLSNPNLAVRLEALGIIARSKSEECRQLVSDCLDDPTKEMRLQAARLLPQYDEQKAYLDLAKLIISSEFAERDFKEKLHVYAALGSTQQPGALSTFAGMLQQKSLFNKKKVTEDKLLAIAGLSNLASIPSFQLLQTEAANKSSPEQVQMAARRGMLAVKKALFGEEEAEDEG